MRASTGPAAAAGAPLVAAESGPTAAYWDTIASQWLSAGEPRAWRLLSDAVNARLLAQWLPTASGDSVLKTDLFDEVAGNGLVPVLSTSFREVTGIDISPTLVELARVRHPGLRAEVADVRRLPYPDESFDGVVSISTLDHFAAPGEIGVALRELHRVTRRGGTLLVTLDNPLHPLVALRNALPGPLRAALVPFAVGATCGPRRLRSLLAAAGYEVARSTAVFHAPRALVVLAGRLVDRHAGAALKRNYVALWTGFERLARLPTRYLTGCFVAALARRR
ncbi:MAG: class I SAM-dependent methyltransferase [Thermoanaerobaculia bacterium]|nr:class I SAM-dependent methyltransferase [Thermoanaerobaculia bacterium]